MTVRRPSAPARHAAPIVGRLWILGIALLAGSACSGEKTFEPPDREARVADADNRLTAQTFDTISWESAEARGMAGNITFSAKCRNCHGTFGEGNTAYGNDRGLEIPSLLDPDWPWADSIDAVRRRVFIGHAQGMPTWGVAGITPREIDGVSYYVLEVLRAEPAVTP